MTPRAPRQRNEGERNLEIFTRDIEQLVQFCVGGVSCNSRAAQIIVVVLDLLLEANLNGFANGERVCAHLELIVHALLGTESWEASSKDATHSVENVASVADRSPQHHYRGEQEQR